MRVREISIALAAIVGAAFTATGLAYAQVASGPGAIQFEVTSKTAEKWTKEMSSAIKAALLAEPRFTFDPPAKGERVLRIVLTDAGVAQDVRTKKNELLGMVDYQWSNEREPTSVLAPCPLDSLRLCAKTVVEGALDMIEPTTSK